MTDPLEIKIRNAVNTIEPSDDFSDRLWKKIKLTPLAAPAAKKSNRWMWIPTSIVLAVGLIFVLAAPQTVLAAFRSLLAYIPGIGLVENAGSTLYLSEPVSLEKEGITLVIEQVVADSTKTTLSYRFEGLPLNDSGSGSPCFYDNTRLILPDGTDRLPIGGGITNNAARVEFPPMPAGITKAKLVSSMNIADPACTAPLEWSLDFTLGSTPANVDFLPVVESTESAEALNPTPEQPVQFVIDKTVVLDEGYLMVGHINWLDKNWTNVQIDMENMTAIDANGKNVPVLPTDEGTTDNEFAFKIQSRDFVQPLTLQVKSLYIFSNVDQSAAFTFDAGSDPQVGQSWQVNQELDILGQKVMIHSVKAVRESDEMGKTELAEGYAVELSNSSNVQGFLVCQGNEEASAMTWGQTNPVGGNREINESYYPDGLPAGKVNCSFRNVSFKLPGLWQFDWQPPVE